VVVAFFFGRCPVVGNLLSNPTSTFYLIEAVGFLVPFGCSGITECFLVSVVEVFKGFWGVEPLGVPL